MTSQLLHPSRRLSGHAGQREFEAIYDRHHAALFGFCRHMLGSREEAEDALQQVFVAAYRELQAGREPEHLRAWLYAIARNRCVSMLRARRDDLAAAAAPEPSTDGFAVAAEVERREELEELLGDLARLPEEQRAALVLAELGDLAHDEIAEALGVRRDKVKALIFQAREALGAWREARATPCREIRQQLATLRGSALRRAPLRRHVAVCPSCAAFEREVARQRSAMALLVPVAPGLALKHSVLRASEAAGALGASAGAGAAAAGAGLSAKALAVAAVVLSAGGAGTVAVRELDPPAPPARIAASPPARPAAVPVRRATTAAPADHHVPAPRLGKAPVRRVAADRATRPDERGRSSQAPGITKSRSHPDRASSPAARHDRGQHARPAVPPGRLRKPATGSTQRSTPSAHPAPKPHPAAAPPVHVTPAKPRATKRATAPVPVPPVAVPEAAGRSAAAPGHAKG